MSYTTKRKVMNSSVYIVIALVTLAVLMISIATAIGMKSKNPPPVPTVDDTGTLASEKGSPSPEKPTASASKPTVSPESPTITPSDDKPVIDPVVKPAHYLPTEGSVFKGYSMDMPVFSLTMNDYRAHTGVDISADIGSAVVSMTDGTVCNVWNDPMMGMCISVDHGEGLISHYKNLSSELPEGIAIGSAVSAGQTIGAVGDTCLVELAETEHLHFEITKEGKHIDPMGYLESVKE